MVAMSSQGITRTRNEQGSRHCIVASRGRAKTFSTLSSEAALTAGRRATRRGRHAAGRARACEAQGSSARSLPRLGRRWVVSTTRAPWRA
jgi:hypothetical protein